MFWVCSILFTSHQIIEIWWSIPIVHAYLDDILAPSIVLGLALAFFQNLFPADHSFTLPWYLILIFVIWYALFFEVIFPAKDSRHYADILDVFAYLGGAFIFYFWGNKPKKLNNT